MPDPDSLRKIADNLSEADRADLEAVGHTDAHKVITEAVAGAREAYIARWNGEPQAVFGVTDYVHDHHHGIPWLLSTGSTPPSTREFLKLARCAVAGWSPMYLSLCNVAGAQHPTAHALLKALGFHLGAEHQLNGHNFTEYARHV
ncbi:hypothetical protein [Rhodanobacter sp. PCA2]|uniref:hypothetical protein n=1 Tax=Rhodanobacter sp. PCA2 TaxID=2006117 RepID=UPI0015E7DDC8|nr:hypothetical protein [Rhodanobacter sp. PCA2]MBA2077050.1 hypothetical protein [Rhodanobacter sp. PCA2]